MSAAAGPADAEHPDGPHGAAYEAQHVHAVYDAIAPHFAATRYKVCAAAQQTRSLTAPAQ